MTSKSDVESDPFLYAFDATGVLRRIVSTKDVQIGFEDFPAELQVTGRSSFASRIVTPAAATSTQILENDTFVLISERTTHVTCSLPTDPRVGQVVFVKDEDGTAASKNIVVKAPAGIDIDGSNTKTLAFAYECFMFEWTGSGWMSFPSGSGDGVGSGGGGGGGAPVDSTYLVLSTNATLTHERRLNVSGATGLKLNDSGAGSTATLSVNDGIVATLTGSIFSGIVTSTAGFSGSLTALSDGTPFIRSNSGINTVTASNGSVTLSIDDDVVATLTGSHFSGIVKSTLGFSGSLTTLVDGTPYLRTNSGLSTTTGSNGAVTFSIDTSALVTKAQSSSNPHKKDRYQFVAGHQTTVAASASRQAVGTCWYDPSDLRSGNKRWGFYAVLETSTGSQSARVDLYDVNGIYAYPPAALPGSEMENVSLVPSRSYVDLSSIFTTITGSGVIELRLWMHPSGAVGEHFVACSSGFVDVTFELCLEN